MRAITPCPCRSAQLALSVLSVVLHLFWTLGNKIALPRNAKNMMFVAVQLCRLRGILQPMLRLLVWRRLSRETNSPWICRHDVCCHHTQCESGCSIVQQLLQVINLLISKRLYPDPYAFLYSCRWLTNTTLSRFLFRHCFVLLICPCACYLTLCQLLCSIFNLFAGFIIPQPQVRSVAIIVARAILYGNLSLKRF